MLSRILHSLWRRWAQAELAFQEAVYMARESEIPDADSETGLALAKAHLGHLTDSRAREEVERLERLREPAHRYLAMLCQAIGDLGQAKKHALAAYKWAWADGEPYVHRYELDKTIELLDELGVPIPDLPPYDPSKYEPFDWEVKIRALIEERKAEREAQEKKSTPQEPF